MKNNQLLTAVVLVSLALVSRILCAELSAYNFAPVVAIGLISGVLVKDLKTAVLLALAGQFLADVYFQIFPSSTNYGFYGMSQFFVYAGIIASAFIGRFFKRLNFTTALVGTVSASIAFFVLSNLGFFLQGYNGFSWAGFVKTYVDAIPFFKNSLQADLLASGILFVAYQALKTSGVFKLKTA